MSKKNIIVKLVIIFVLSFQLWDLFIILNYPFMGIIIDKNANGQYVVDSIDSPSAGNRLGIKPNDLIITVNGQSPDKYWTAIRFGRLEQVTNITVLRDSNPLEFQTNGKVIIDFWDILSLFVQIASLFLSFHIFKNIKRTSSSIYMSSMFFVISLIFMSLSASIRGDPLSKFVISSSMMLLPVIFFQFLSSFLKEKVNVQLSSFFIKPFYALIASVMATIPFLFINSPLTYSVYSFSLNAVLIVSVAGICANFVALGHLYTRNRMRLNHLSIIIKTVFLALFCAVSPVVFLSFIPQIIFGHAWIEPLISCWFIFILPLTFTYLLATRRLYDVDMVIRRIMFTTVIAIIPSLLFTGIIKLFFKDSASPEHLILVFIIQLSGISFILYSLENMTTKLEATLFPRKHRLQLALKKIARNLGTISSFREMKDIILVDIVETLEVTGGAIVFKYEDCMESICEGQLVQSEVEEIITSGNLDNPTYICIEISRQEEYTSYLVMTQKKSTTMLGMEEVQWLNLIITYLAVSLENVQLIRKLDGRLQQLSSVLPKEEEADNLIWFRKLMFELQEKERIRIATDLHDTTMQDLFFLKGRLGIIQTKYKHAHEDDALLRSLMDYIDIINTNLRQSCFELHPYLLREVGLIGTLNKLFSTERALCSFQINFITSEVSEVEEQDIETKRHLFRLVQELINNAKKHSHATTVRISIYVQQGMLYFEYVDNGVGFEPNRAVVREIGSSGIGMEQMKGRILSLGGRYELDTGVGKGVRFRAHFPVKAGRNSA
jgi:two-component system, NarL family, sensor histidine kinase ComP